MIIVTSKQVTMYLCMQKFWATKLFRHVRTLLIQAEPPFCSCVHLERGVPTLPSMVTDSVKKITSELGFPVVIFAVNPFIYDGYKTANNKSALYRAMKSLGMNYKFAVCAQPLKGTMVAVKSFFGKCSEQDDETKRLCHKVYKIFRIPICKLHVQKTDSKAYLCGLQPVSKKELTEQDLQMISNEVSLLLEQGEPIGV